LIADFSQTDAALLAGESQLFAYTRCHLQSLVPGLARLDRRSYECVQLPLFLHYSRTAKPCQTFVLLAENDEDTT
jgi:hypothetical protein